jgi:ATP-binding cassette, subfamily G (WHITE), member 2, PDR
MTVAETLLFAAKAWTPARGVFTGETRDQFAGHLRDVAMKVFGLNSVADSIVSSELIVGVSGGERRGSA